MIRTNDSIRIVSARLAKLQADVQNDHYEMNRQILTLQELSGQSQRRLQELRGAHGGAGPAGSRACRSDGATR